MQDSSANSPQDNLVATVHDGALRIWGKQTGTFIATIAEKLSSPFVDCSFSKDGKILRGKLQSGHELFYPTDKNFLNGLTVDLSPRVLDKFKE